MRLPPAPETGLTRRFLYAIARRKARQLPDVAAAMGHHRRLLLGYGALEEATARSASMGERVKTLAEIKVAAMIGSEAGAVCALPERGAASEELWSNA
jgi:hypothetical protein